MVQNDAMKFEVNWNLSRKDFLDQARIMIEMTSKNGKKIPLPVEDDIAPGMMLLAGLRCGDCHICCESVMAAALLDTERQNLQKEYGTAGFTEEGLAFPCRFLNAKGCSIYEKRPLVCMTYPLQDGAPSTGGSLLAVESNCPQAKVIALKAYAIAWDLSHKRKQIKEEAEKLIKGGDSHKK